MSFFENWKAFLVAAERQKLSTASQAAFYWIIAKFNEANWVEEIELSDRELMRLTQIRSTKTITDVKSRLKLSGLIDFRTSKYYGTTYKLVQLASSSWSRAQSETQSETQTKTQGKAQTETQGSAPKSVSYTHVREDLKTLRQEDTTTTRTTARAHARADGGESENAAQNIKVAQIAKVSDNVRHCWMQANFMNPTELDEEGLAALEKEFGSEKVFLAIRKANRYKKQPTINLRNVEVVLRGGDKSQNWKGDMGNGNSQSNRPSADDDRFSYRSRYDDL